MGQHSDYFVITVGDGLDASASDKSSGDASTARYNKDLTKYILEVPNDCYIPDNATCPFYGRTPLEVEEMERLMLTDDWYYSESE